MASKNFSRTLVRTQGQRMGRVLSGQFSRKRRTQTGTYLGDNQVRVGGQVYPFRNSSDIDVVPGNQVSVVNVGRTANAVYEPAVGGGTVSVSDGNGTGGTVGAHGLNEHSDVNLSGLASKDVLVWDGSNWVNSTDVAVLSRANTFTAAQTFPNSGVHILDTGGDHDLILASGEDLTADHTLTVTLNDADVALNLGGNFTTPAAGTGALKTGSPTAGNLAQWSDANTVQDASIASSDVARLGTVQTFTAAHTFPNTGLKVEDTDASHTLTLKPGSNLAANRTLTLTTGDADRTVTLSGDLTVPATGTAALRNVANTFTAAQTVQGASNDGITIEGSANPTLKFKESASGSNNIVADIRWDALDSGGADQEYGRLRLYAGSDTAGAEEGQLRLRLADGAGGFNNQVLVAKGNGHLLLNTTTDSAQLSVQADGASTVGVYVNTAASPSADAFRASFNGDKAVSIMDNGVRHTAFRARGFDNGINIGNRILVEQNTNASTPAAGHINLQNLGGTGYRYWPDTNGLLRSHTGDPTNANDTAGTVVGDQSEWHTWGNTTSQINSDLGIGTSPQGRLHGAGDVGRFIFWDFDGLTSDQVVVPNVAGDVLQVLWANFIVYNVTDGFVNSGTGEIEPGGHVDIYSTELELHVNADGSIEVKRVSGTDEFDVALWLIWM